MARLHIRLTPRGGRDAIDGWTDDGVLRVRVAAPPVDGAANDALLRLIAKRAGVPPSRVTLVSGAQARIKLVQIDGVTDAEIRARLL